MGCSEAEIVIFLVLFVRGGFITIELCRVKLVRLDEELCLLGDILKLNFGNLMHLLELLDVALKFRRVGQDCGQVFANLSII